MIDTQVSRSRLRQALVSAVAVAFLAACGGAASPSAAGAGGGAYGPGGAGGSPAASLAGGAGGAASPAAAGGNAVKIIDFGFTPASLTVKAGTTVTWTNTGSATHTVTADNGSFDSGNVASNATFTHTFATAGTFAYHCAIHHSMVATITVTP